MAVYAVLTPEEIADRWRTTPAVVTAMCRAGQIPSAFKVGRQWRLSQTALLAFEKGGQPSTMPSPAECLAPEYEAWRSAS